MIVVDATQDFADVVRAALLQARETFAHYPADDESARAVCSWLEVALRAFGHDCSVSYGWRIDPLAVALEQAGFALLVGARRSLDIFITKRPHDVAFEHTVRA